MITTNSEEGKNQNNSVTYLVRKSRTAIECSDRSKWRLCQIWRHVVKMATRPIHSNHTTISSVIKPAQIHAMSS